MRVIGRTFVLRTSELCGGALPILHLADEGESERVAHEADERGEQRAEQRPPLPVRLEPRQRSDPRHQHRHHDEDNPDLKHVQLKRCSRVALQMTEGQRSHKHKSSADRKRVSILRDMCWTRQIRIRFVLSCTELVSQISRNFFPSLVIFAILTCIQKKASTSENKT